MPINMTLIKKLARKVRYRTLDALIGQQVTVYSLDTVVQDIQREVSLVSNASYLGPEARYIEGMIAKYGILDLDFLGPISLLDTDFEHGIRLLQHLRFIPTRDATQKHNQEKQEWPHDPTDDMEDFTCLEQLNESLERNQQVIRLFLESAHQILRPEQKLGRLVASDLPRVFTVTDACVTNADFIWFHRHFYL